MASFLKKWWRAVAAVALVVAAFQVFASRLSDIPGLAPVRGGGAAAFRGVVGGIDAARDGIRGAWRGYVALARVARENEALRREVETLREARRADQETSRENARLRELLRVSAALERETVGARVIGHDVSPWFQALFIDAGSEAGIQPGMAVVAVGGAVGRIHAVYPRLSEVLLLTDARFAADVIVERTRVRAIAEGAGGRMCGLKYVSLTQDVVRGDRVILSGFDGSMPKGTLLGTVVSADRPEEGFFQHVRVVTAVDLQAVEEVLVVLSRPSIPFRAERY